VRASGRAAPSGDAINGSVGLCGRRHEGLQLMRLSVDARESHGRKLPTRRWAGRRSQVTPRGIAGVNSLSCWIHPGLTPPELERSISQTLAIRGVQSSHE
jgi:hypothetical protein